MQTSIIIPALNEAATVEDTLAALQAMRRRGHEVIVVDGGSTDSTLSRAQPLADRVIESPRGRAVQMNAGSQQARGEVLWFLHSDTRVPDNADRVIETIFTETNRHWGRFNVRLSGRHPLFRVIEFMMNLRSRLTGIATGDQGIFIRRDSFEKLGGFREIALMEDIDMSKRLKQQYARPACVSARLITSSRRWEKQGIINTVFLMWRLRLAYFFGADPVRLSRLYSQHR